MAATRDKGNFVIKYYRNIAVGYQRSGPEFRKVGLTGEDTLVLWLIEIGLAQIDTTILVHGVFLVLKIDEC